MTTTATWKQFAKGTISTVWQTVATVGYTGAVATPQNYDAHGGVCHLQVRANARGHVIGRKVNSNGRHEEASQTFAMTPDRLAQWQKLAR